VSVLGRGLAAVAIAWTVILHADPARAQGPAPAIDCAYDACALRVRYHFFGSDLVRGVRDEKVAGLGMFVGNLDDEFAGSPAAQDLAERYRSRHNTGGVLGLLGAVATVAAVFTLEWDTPTENGGGFALLFGGAALALTGGIIESSGRDYINRAVWEYNRSLRR
jgi:hypothetical protein